MRSFFLLAALALGAAAQTWTSCNPLNQTCPPDTALGTEHTWYMNSTSKIDTDIWNMTNSMPPTYTDDGADFTLSKEGEAVLVTSNFYIFFGVVESWVKMSPGVVSCSNPTNLDEIDWEWVGNDTNSVQTDFFGKGNTTTYGRGTTFPVKNAASEWHNYTTYWTSGYLEWWVDGQLARNLTYDDPLTLGGNYPQTPCRIKVSIWPAGLPGVSKWTIQWAGGLVNWDEAPFTMSVKSIRAKDFHSGKEYIYGNRSGSYQSIKVIDGNSTIADDLNKKPSESVSDKWNKLPEGAHIGVYVAAGVVGAIAVAGFLFWCLRQRRNGRLENALGDNQHANERDEMQNYQNDWKQSEWRATEWRNSGYGQIRS
ncbi:extracellular glycosidase [Penicillium chermesinum]|nr:extracellular glycosidase [Penicillium chermesinum]